jgi:hypothetical protein
MTGAFTLFTTSGSDLFLSDFNVVGDNTSTQTFLNISGVDAIIERVDVEDVRYVVQASSTPEVTFRDCFLRLAGSAGTTSFWRGATNGKMTWDYVEMFVPTSGNNLIEGATTASAGCSWTVVDSYTGGGGGGPSTNFYYTQVIEFVNFKIDNAQFLVNAAQNKIDSCFFEDSSIRFVGVWNQISNTVFSQGGTGSGGLYDAQVAFVLPFAGIPAECTVTGCEFYGNGASVYGITIDNSYDIVITGNDFYNHSTAAVHLTAGTSPNPSKAVVTGNNFDLSGGAPVLEDDSNCVGRYNGNEGFEGSTIAGSNSTVEGIRRKDVVGGATTDAFVSQFTHANDKGLVGGGTIKNTGGSNTLTVRLSATDVFGTTGTFDADVAPGATASWSMLTNVGTALYPFVSYSVLVKSTSAGNPTTFTLYHASDGAY